MRLPSAFVPLRTARFRNLWLAGLVSFLGTWVHNVAARWTAASLETSPLLVSAVDTLQLVPMVVLGVAAGAFADTHDRRRVLVATHLGLAAVCAAMAVLAYLERLGLAGLLGLTCLLGVLGALTGPAWQATVPRQVPDDQVPSAVALMSTGFNLARAIGPGVGAWMLVSWGPAAAFATNACSYALISVLMWRLPPQPPAAHAGPRPSPLGVPSLRRLYGVGAAFGLVAMPSLSLLPIVARDGIHGGAEAYGALLSAFGAGAVAAGVLVASGGRRFGAARMVVATCLLSAAGFLQLARAMDLADAIVGAAICGAGWIGTVATVNARVQIEAPASVRARALAFYLAFAVGGQALGSLQGGWLATHLGLPTALRVDAAALVCLAIAVGIGYTRGMDGEGR